MASKKQSGGMKPTIEYLNDKKPIVTPDGVAAFAHLTEPDEAFGKIKQRITMFFDKSDPKFKKFVKVLRALNAKWLKEQGQKVKGVGPLPACIKATDEKLAETTGQEVGTPYMQFSSSPRYDGNGDVIGIPVIGPNGKKTKLLVYGTDLVCVETTIAGYKTPQGIGITCYLNAVQLLEKRYEGSGGGGGGSFAVRDDYIMDDDDDDETPGMEEGDADEETHGDFLDDNDGDDGDDDPADGMI